MHVRKLHALLVALALALASCGDDEAGPHDGGAAPASGAWQRLIENDWALDAGAEALQWCTKRVLDEDLYVTALRPVHPLGTHHTTLSMTDDDGSTECGTQTAIFQGGLVYGAAVGTEGLELPPGVAMHFPKGKALNLALHLYNATDEALHGVSAIEVKTIPEGEVEHLAEAMMVGPLSLSIPPGRQTVEYTCAVTEEQTVFAYMPHMHQLGTHFKTTVVAGGEERTIHDGAFRFDEQFQWRIDPLELSDGDTITNVCTYQNDTDRTVTFGESTTTEMCFALMFRYPATGNTFCIGDRNAAMPDGGALEPCAMPGDEGNELGVGEYCEGAGGSECADNGGAGICILDFDPTGYSNFCSMPCESDDQCGHDALCKGPGPGQLACFPIACTAPEPP